MKFLAPGERDLVAFLEAYFDESGSHDGSPVLCVAGYLFEKNACRKLDLAWKELLDRFGLPHFHMVDCAHGNPPFDRLSMDERIEVEKEAIHIIRSHALFGMGVGLVESEYDEIFPPSMRFQLPRDELAAPLPGNAYSYCCWTALVAIYGWIAANRFNGEITYFFESGHKHGKEANAIMNRIFKVPRLRNEYRYSAHSFVDKQKVRPIQTADIIAWQHATDIKKILSGKPRRKDYLALLEGQNVEMKLIGREHLLMARTQIADTLGQIRKGQLITGTFGGHRFVSGV